MASCQSAQISQATAEFLYGLSGCEDGEEKFDLTSAQIIDLIQAKPRRDSTHAMLNLHCPGVFTRPRFLDQNSIASIARSHRCEHEHDWGTFLEAFQMCEACSVTQSHADFSGHGALLTVLKGHKLFALTAARKRQYGKLDKWAALPEDDPALWWSEYGMNLDSPVFAVEVFAGQAIWIPPGWVHFVLSVEESHQVGYNAIPTQLLPRAITHWRQERKETHNTTPCILPCGCQPRFGAEHFSTTVAQYMRSKPQLSKEASRMIQQFLTEEHRHARPWQHYCDVCHPLQATLDWMSAQRAAENPPNLKRALKRLAQKKLK